MGNIKVWIVLCIIFHKEVKEIGFRRFLLRKRGIEGGEKEGVNFRFFFTPET